MCISSVFWFNLLNLFLAKIFSCLYLFSSHFKVKYQTKFLIVKEQIIRLKKKHSCNAKQADMSVKNDVSVDEHIKLRSHRMKPIFHHCIVFAS